MRDGEGCQIVRYSIMEMPHRLEADGNRPTIAEAVGEEPLPAVPKDPFSQHLAACEAFYAGRVGLREHELRRHYHELVRRNLKALVPEGAKVLEVGCGLGDLMASLRPGLGVGLDLCPGMVERARVRHPNYVFHATAVESFECDERFDYVVMCDTLNDVYDVEVVLARVRTFAHARTRLIVTFFNHLWRPVLAAAARVGWKSPTPAQNWLSEHDMGGLLRISGWEVVRSEARILWPIRTPLWEPLLNRWMAPFLRHLCLAQVLVARPTADASEKRHFTCSVVVPARNEAGNIEPTVRRIPELGAGTEVILVEGGSADDTWKEMQRVAASPTCRHSVKVLRQSGRGKKQAVVDAFEAATGELLFILDADLSVPPEELGKFYAALHSGLGEFANGVRLVYPMEAGAMRFLNMVANRFFRAGFSFVLGQPIRDTLCGTKVMFRADYQAMSRLADQLGKDDPFGDFDLLFGAARLSLRMVDIPVHYRARTYGETNIRRWHHGLQLLRLLGQGARRILFLR